MSQMLHSTGAQVALASHLARLSNPETYQTNLNHPQHSKWRELRLTLEMLWFLRVPLMVRTALIAFLFVPFLASSAAAAGVNAVRDPAHANAARSAVHRIHRSQHSSLRTSRTHSSRTPARIAHPSTARRGSQTAARRPSRSYAHRTISSPRSSTRLRGIRYSHSRSRAHFVPLATVPVARSTRELATTEGTSADANATTEAPGPGEPSSSAGAASAEADSVSPQDNAASAIAVNGNPLAEPPATAPSPIPPAAQLAELDVPRVYGRYALRGSHDSLVRQNQRAEEESLERIEDDADLQDRIGRGLLVRVPESSGLEVNSALPDNRRYCRPWTADFLTELSRAHQAEFHRPLVVSSAVRTVEYQKRLMRINHNAADAEGDIVSPHLTGATIDIAKSGLSRREMQWMRDHLFAYQTAGVIDVEEEFRQRCFHITVYRDYAPSTSDRPHHAAVPQTVPPDASSATVSSDPDNNR